MIPIAAAFALFFAAFVMPGGKALFSADAVARPDCNFPKAGAAEGAKTAAAARGAAAGAAAGIASPGTNEFRGDLPTGGKDGKDENKLPILLRE